MSDEAAGFQRWTVVALVAGTAAWCWLASAQTKSDFVTFLSIAVMSFAAGCAAGFIFSTYDEEAQSVGKVKDWILGALTGVALTQLAKGGEQIYRFFAQFKSSSASESAVAVMLAMAVAEIIAGFFLMYFNRELYLNPLLHRSRQQLKKLAENAEPALKKADEQAPVTTKADAAPVAVASSAADVDSVDQLIRYVESNRVRPQDITDPSLLTKIANAYYHVGEYEKAAPFFRQALLVSPQDADAGMKLAVALSTKGRYREAVEICRMLEDRGLGIPEVYKLLGYFTLWTDENEAIKYGIRYTAAVPSDSGGIFNLACAYAQRFEKHGQPVDREMALKELQTAVEKDPGWRHRALELTENDSFTVLKDDPEFQKIVSGG